MFAKLIPHLCHISNKDDKFEIQLHVNTSVGIRKLILHLPSSLPLPSLSLSSVSSPPNIYLFLYYLDVSEQLFSDIAFNQLLTLLKKEVSDHSRHLHQYFQAFLAYAHKGPYEV